MLIAVTLADTSPPATTWRLVVPGDQIWSPRSFRATANRGAGGAPDRAYQLTITDGTNIVAAVGADDAGGEPGTCEITWCNTPAAAVTSGNVGIVIAPLPALQLMPGYVITGAIVNAVAGDAWDTALVWTDFIYSDA